MSVQVRLFVYLPRVTYNINTSMQVKLLRLFQDYCYADYMTKINMMHNNSDSKSNSTTAV